MFPREFNSPSWGATNVNNAVRYLLCILSVFSFLILLTHFEGGNYSRFINQDNEIQDN